MAAIPIQDQTFSTPLTPTMAAAAAGDTIAINPGENVWLEVANGGGSSVNVTLTAVTTAGQIAGAPVTLGNNVTAVAAGASKRIGPIPPAFVATDGTVAVAYSATASVTRAAIRLIPNRL